MMQIQFSLIKKIKVGLPEHSLISHLLRPITSHFCLTPQPLKMDVIYVPPLTAAIKKVFKQYFDLNDNFFSNSHIFLRNSSIAAIYTETI